MRNFSCRVCSVIEISTLKDPADRQEGVISEYSVLAHQGAPYLGGYGTTQRLRLFNKTVSFNQTSVSAMSLLIANNQQSESERKESLPKAGRPQYGPAGLQAPSAGWDDGFPEAKSEPRAPREKSEDELTLAIFLQGCKGYPAEKALRKELCVCAMGLECPMAGHHHAAQPLEKAARRLAEKKASAHKKAATPPPPPKPTRWYKCSCERAEDCPYGGNHYHPKGKQIKIEDLHLKEEPESTPESIAASGATLSRILASVREREEELEGPDINFESESEGEDEGDDDEDVFADDGKYDGEGFVFGFEYKFKGMCSPLCSQCTPCANPECEWNDYDAPVEDMSLSELSSVCDSVCLELDEAFPPLSRPIPVMGKTKARATSVAPPVVIHVTAPNNQSNLRVPAHAETEPALVVVVEEKKSIPDGDLSEMSPSQLEARRSAAQQFVDAAKLSANMAEWHGAIAEEDAKNALRQVNNIAMRTVSVLVFEDHGSASKRDLPWYKRWAAKTFLGDTLKEHVVNARRGATLSEAQTIGIKDLEDFYWFWQKPKIDTPEGIRVKEMSPTRAEAKEDILYFANLFTHCENRPVYEVLCETILRNKKFRARMSSLLQEDGTGLKIARTTVLAVDDVISTHPFYAEYTNILDMQVLMDTRTHILNQILLYGLMANSAAPAKGGKAAVGLGRKGKLQVLFRRGGPSDLVSPLGLPSASLSRTVM